MKHLTATDRALRGLALLAALVVYFGVICLCGGCVYKGCKLVEGTDLAVGLNVPTTEGALQLQVLNYLSGFRLGVAENAALVVEYETFATNSYFGCVRTETTKRVKARVEPCADDAATTNAVEEVAHE